MKKIYIISAFLLGILNSLYSQTRYKLDFSQKEPLVRDLKTIVTNPHWSRKASWLGADITEEDCSSVLLYNLDKQCYTKFNVGMSKRTQISQPFLPTDSQGAQTIAINFSSGLDNAFYILSSLNNKYDLFLAYGIRVEKGVIKIGGCNNKTTGSVFMDKNITYLTTSINPDSQEVGLFILKNEVYLWDVNLALTSPYIIRFDNEFIKYELDLYCMKKTDPIQMKIAYIGSNNQYPKVYITAPVNKNNTIAQSTILTDTVSKAVERLPMWSPDGRYVAYLSSLGHEKEISFESFEESELEYGLWIYDSQTGQNEELFFPVYTNTRRSTQSVYGWMPDSETIFFINCDLNNKLPLYAVNIKTKTIWNLGSPYINHNEIKLSPDSKYLAIIARGIHGADEYSFTKIYLAKVMKTD